jgi:acylphosphatase
MKVRRRIVVEGQVQGVFFRSTCRREAQSRGVTGWVRNRPDGTVEAVLEGEPDAVDGVIAWAHQGPPAAWVSRVEVTEEDPVGERSFQVR